MARGWRDDQTSPSSSGRSRGLATRSGRGEGTGTGAGLSPFAGAAPGERVKVAALEVEGGGVANISVSPSFKLQDKPFTLEMGVPI